MIAAGNTNAVAFLLITIFLDSVGIGILIPVIPELIKELAGVNISQAAIYGGAITALFSLVQFFSSPILGSLSDSLGRRPVILVSLLAFGLNYVMMGLAPSLAWLFFAQALAGLFGATHSVAAAYITDITDPLKRAGPFGMMGAAFGLGFMVGPVLSGLVSEWGIRLPFFIAASLALLNVLYGIYALPESLSRRERRQFRFRQSSAWSVFRHLHRYPQMTALLFATLLMQLGLQSVTVTWPYFTTFQYGWTPREIGFSLGLYGIVTVVTQGFILKKLVDWYGDAKAANIGLVLMIVGLLGFALSDHPALGVLFIVPHAMAFMSQGALRSLMSQGLSANEQGALQGAIISVNSFAAIISPLLMPWLFSVFSSGVTGFVFAGAPYVLGAAFAFMSILLIHPHRTLNKIG
ncbi:TCR/Tet family MFS transporter [Parahaliea maris]|uniref:TCR/Tet family MFS transporter n=1 Tax=Parahaliea maris TaxID=2716870 RepID=A0A5C8ZVJ9_9GAMM|nr:MFS transporter [Parahaliea maris]TXS91869.1 TCR/Tet family MFS transporter [Parahaliea maris]